MEEIVSASPRVIFLRLTFFKFDEYASGVTKDKDSTTDTVTSLTTGKGDNYTTDRFHLAVAARRQRVIQTPRDPREELVLYLQDDLPEMVEKYDIVGWWKVCLLFIVLNSGPYS